MGNRWPLPDNNLPASPHTVSWTPPLHSNLVQPNIDNFTAWTEGSTTSDGATLSGPAAYADYSTAYVPMVPVNVPIPNDPAMQSQKLPAYSVPSNANSDPRQSMPPPALNPRKRKAPTLRAGDWTPVKARIIELHIDDNMPLPEVKIAIEEEFPFEATLRQYRSAVTSWGFDKNVKKNVMQAIVRKRQHRRLVEPGKKDLNFKVHNFTVNPGKVDTWMKRNNIPGDAIYAPSPAASTPAEMMAWTPSEQASSPSIGAPSVHTPIAMAIESLQGGYGNTIHSPAPSVSRILQSHDRNFTGQCPTAWPASDEAHTHPYLSADQAQLRLQFFQYGEPFGLDENPDILNTEFELGDLFLTQERYRSAEGIFRKLTTRYQILYGKSHKHTLRALSRLGQALCEQGLLSMAMKIFQECFKIQKIVLGLDDPETLTTLCWFARVVNLQGHYSDGEAMQLQILRLHIKLLGAEHPRTLYSMLCIASALAFQGRYFDAEAMHRQILQSQIKVLGTEHPNTLHSIGNVAYVLALQGRYVEAEAIHRQVLKLQIKVLGAEHPHSLCSMVCVGYVLTSQGCHSEAEAIHRQVLEIQTKVLGVEHPNTLHSMTCVGFLLASQGHPSEAEVMYRQVLKIRTKVLGAEHPYTLSSMLCLVWVVRSQGHHFEANIMHRQASELQTKLLGAKHLVTLASKEISTALDSLENI